MVPTARNQPKGAVMIVVIGHLQIPPEKMDQAKVAIASVVTATLKEPGCLLYAFSQDALEPGTIRITEKWESWDALKAHAAMPHLAAWRAALKEIGLRGREVTAYEAGETRAL
jgi:quinol monooxygenase YgiN